MRRFFQYLAVFILGIILAVALAEFILANTHFIDTPPGLFKPSPTRAFEHHPGFHGKDIRGNPILINSMGLRDGEYALRKPEGVFRILVLGDSVAFGDGIRAQDTFVKKLEVGLNPNPRGVKVEVLNGGVRGYNTFQELQLLKEVGLRYEPDWVILAYVLNDAEPMEKQAGLINKKFTRFIGLKDFIKQHSYLYAFLRRNMELLRHRVTPREFLETYDRQFDPASPGWRVSKEALREMKSLADERRIRLLVAVFPRLVGLKTDETYPAQGIQNQVVQTAGKELGIDTLDLLPALKGYDAESLKVTKTDTFHLNPQGHDIVARALKRYVFEKFLSGPGN